MSSALDIRRLKQCIPKNWNFPEISRWPEEEKDENLSHIARGEICLLEREHFVEETGAGTMMGQ